MAKTAISITERQINSEIKQRFNPIERIKSMYEELGENDLVVICTLNAIPFEYTEYGFFLLGSSIAEAAKRGAHFLCISPSEYILKELELVVDYLYGVPLNKVYARLKKSLEQQHNLPSEIFNQRFKIIQPDSCLFWTMNILFELCCKSSNLKKPESTLFTFFPFKMRKRFDDSNVLLLHTNCKTKQAFITYLMNKLKEENLRLQTENKPQHTRIIEKNERLLSCLRLHLVI